MRASFAFVVALSGFSAALCACATVPESYEQFEASGGFSMYEIPSPEQMAQMGAMVTRLTGGEPPSDAEAKATAESLAAEPERLGPEFYLSASGDPSLDAEQLAAWARRYAAEQTVARGYAYYLVTGEDAGMGVENMRAVGDAIVSDPARYVNMILTLLPADAEPPSGAVDAASALAAFGERN